MSNPYLDAQRKKYEALRESMKGLQTRAADEERDLTEDELRSITEQSEQAKTLAKQIEELTEIEQRNAKVSELAATLHTSDEGEQTKTRNLGSARTQDRDPGHYRQNGDHSFFGDLYRSKSFGDSDAAQRLHEHNRALSTGSQGAGVVPPKWLTDEYAEIAKQGRNLANAVRNIPLGDDPRPLTLPKQTGSADVAEQANENDTIPGTDAWDSDVDTVTPKPLAGKQTVSRQLVDMSSPAIDQLIFGDLLSSYNAKVEDKVGKAVRGVGTALTATEAQFSDLTTADTNGSDLAVLAAVAVRKARHMPANILAMSIDRYGEYLQLKDSTGRPLIPDGSEGPMNVVGVGSVNVDGRIKGLGVVATEGMATGGTTDTFAALRANDVILFESNMLRFRFEEQSGPESIVLGIWGYTAELVRHGTKAVKTVDIDTSTPA